MIEKICFVIFILFGLTFIFRDYIQSFVEKNSFISKYDAMMSNIEEEVFDEGKKEIVDSTVSSFFYVVKSIIEEVEPKEIIDSILFEDNNPEDKKLYKLFKNKYNKFNKNCKSKYKSDNIFMGYKCCQDETIKKCCFVCTEQERKEFNKAKDSLSR